MSILKRNSQNKAHTLKTQIQKKISNNELLSSTTDFNSDYLLPTQSDINKRIANRLRVRKATGSQKRITRETPDRNNTTDKLIEDIDPIEQFQHKIDQLWENNEDVSHAVNNFASVLDPKELKSKLVKDWGLLQCQLVTHDLEEIVLNRISKLGEMARTAKRCKQQQQLMGKKFQQRMKKLGEQLKSR